jgi:hypothetical protein
MSLSGEIVGDAMPTSPCSDRIFGFLGGSADSDAPDV